jgi:broad specificity phosphatase PhoE
MNNRVRVLVVRHGESELNVKKIIAGHLPTPLTELGVRQAHLLGQSLASEGIDIIYSSDLRRAQQTTAEISKFVDAPVRLDVRLRERTWGQLDQVTHDEYKQILADSGEPYHEFRPPNGESLIDLLQRAESFLEEILPKHFGETVLISAHHSLNKAILLSMLKKSWSDWSGMVQDNTCVNELLMFEDGSAEAVRINDTTHLR